jgi:hypothetical protein
MTNQATQEEDPLYAYVLSILTPLLLTTTLTEATKAARQLIAAYQTTVPDQLLSIAQVVGFALASLDDLRLSAAPDRSLTMKLRLRGNANALNRSSTRTAATLKTHDKRPPVEATQPKTETPAQQAANHQIDLAWAAAMQDVAIEYTAELATLPEAQRRVHQARINALKTTAGTLTRGEAPSRKSRLLSTTALNQ